MSAAEYLAFERASADRHEFVDGELYSMSGASYAHNLILFALAFRLQEALLSGGCRVVTSGQRIAMKRRANYVYPDIVVVCGAPELEDDHGDTLLNPTVIVEVLSPSTERFDRGRKLEMYKTIESVREVLLVSQELPQVDVYTRHGDGFWVHRGILGLEATLTLGSVPVSITLAELYRGVELSAEAPPSAEERGT